MREKGDPDLHGDENSGEPKPGKWLIRVNSDKQPSLTERIVNRLSRLSWHTPFYALRLRGRPPLRLMAVPRDPFSGNAEAGNAIRHGEIRFFHEKIKLDHPLFPVTGISPEFTDYLHSFIWLRDLAAAGNRQEVAKIAEKLTRNWLEVHADEIDDKAWQPDIWGRRILFWGAYAPLILSSTDLVYRSKLLNSLARGGRHLSRSADKMPNGLNRAIAWMGLVAATLLLPDEKTFLQRHEQGLLKALNRCLFEDGGIISRTPYDQLELVEYSAMLLAVYHSRDMQPNTMITRMMARAVRALLGVTLGDGGLASFQGGVPVDKKRVDAAIYAAGIRSRPLSRAGEWGYQRLSHGQTTLVIDTAPPPVIHRAGLASASTLAFEMSDGADRLIVNCGGVLGSDLDQGDTSEALPPELSQLLRATAAHSTLVLKDSNSTALMEDGSLGRGVSEVELDRHEGQNGSLLEASHDGYMRRFGFIHRRKLALSANGWELRGEDILLPAGRRRASEMPFILRFHLAPWVEVTNTADGMGALLRIERGALWQFRCRGGKLGCEPSIWIDPTGWPRLTNQITISGLTPAGGCNIDWVLKRAG
ncbi:putative heparinase superfamily protein [Zymomonas mobilis]|uniref:heparinase II/III family protein n=1 Tax=Zymomonas mobilis TaxID=542 RepID=UPI001153FB17|nr:heparinase II/III family protein [Zymomonas mobilis]TQL29325.1 putative heparinase superfamily protein [Zymomonas mobilis]